MGVPKTETRPGKSALIIEDRSFQPRHTFAIDGDPNVTLLPLDVTRLRRRKLDPVFPAGATAPQYGDA
jgi:hypothetical protein